MKRFVMMDHAARPASLSRTPSDAPRGAAEERRRLDGNIFIKMQTMLWDAAAKRVCYGEGIFLYLMKHFITNK